MHDISTVEVIVPQWAEDIEDQTFLTFLAFLYRINVQHGYETYGIVSSDINTILATTTETAKYIYKHWPIAKEWLTIQSTAFGMTYVTLKEQKRYVHGSNFPTTRKEINEHRPLMIWIYLLGAFNRNLLTEDPFPYRTDFTMFGNDRKLFAFKHQYFF